MIFKNIAFFAFLSFFLFLFFYFFERSTNKFRQQILVFDISPHCFLSTLEENQRHSSKGTSSSAGYERWKTPPLKLTLSEKGASPRGLACL